MFDAYPETRSTDESGLLCGPRTITADPLPFADPLIKDLVYGPYQTDVFLYGMMEKSFMFRATDPKTPLGPSPFGVKIEFDNIPGFIPHPTYVMYKDDRASPLFLPIPLEVRSAEALLKDRASKIPTHWKDSNFASIASGSTILVKFGKAVKIICTAMAYDESVKKSECREWIDGKGCKDEYVTTQVRGTTGADNALIIYCV